MKAKTHQYGILYDRPLDFFELGGSGTIQMSRECARQVCLLAQAHRQVVLCIEGGIWHNPGFEARLDAIWDRDKFATYSKDDVQKTNEQAAESVGFDNKLCDAFIVTTGDTSA